MSDLPGWSCPAIDRVAEAVRRHVPEPARTDALICLESIRLANVQLRNVATGRNPERAAAEVARLDQRIAALEGKLRCP